MEARAAQIGLAHAEAERVARERAAEQEVKVRGSIM